MSGNQWIMYINNEYTKNEAVSNHFGNPYHVTIPSGVHIQNRKKA